MFHLYMIGIQLSEYTVYIVKKNLSNNHGNKTDRMCSRCNENNLEAVAYIIHSYLAGLDSKLICIISKIKL